MRIDTNLPGFKQPQNKSTNNEPNDQLFFKLTGDEYYWQHQEQLQHSELDFNTEGDFLESKSTVDNPLMPRNNPFKQLDQASLATKELFNTVTPPLCNEHQSCAISYSPDLMYETTLARQNDLPFPATSSQPVEQIDTPVNALTPGVKTMQPQPVLKKHHLFVDQHEVELTLNTQDLEPNEESDFITTIKAYLKKKGLFLKKLMINGALHD